MSPGGPLIFFRIFPNFHIFDTWGGGVIRSYTRKLPSRPAINSQEIMDILEEDEEVLSDNSGVSSDSTEDETCVPGKSDKLSSSWWNSDMF